MKLYIVLFSFFISVVIESKPLEDTNDFEVKNEIDYENSGGKDKNESEENRKKLFRQSESSGEESNTQKDENGENNGATSETSGSIKPQKTDNSVVNNFLLPILQKWKFSPETFFQDRLNALKQSLGNLGWIVPPLNSTNPKQFATTNGILHLVGLNDSGFYTDRFEPAGFFGGNGWFANKGGILGGPGAIISTGSLLTDYPTPYRK